MEDIDIATIKKRSLKGIIALTSRTFFIQIIAFASTFLLTIFLSPSVFGVFYVVSAIISFLSYFSDVGLAAALIQKKEQLTEKDLVTTFTIQQLLVVILCSIMLLASPFFGSFYQLDNNGVWLLRSLILAFFVSSLKTIPSILLERKLDFNKLVIPQLIETIVFYGVAVGMAWKGFGIVSFSAAVLSRAFVGLVVMYIVSPWTVKIGIDKTIAKQLLKFGVPFQANSVLALVKDDLMTIFLGKILPFSQIGYIGWAKKWAEVPLRLVMDSVIRVTFPAFSRLQHSKELLRSAIEKTMFGLACSITPIAVGLLFFVEPLVKLIPKYGKWEPALLCFYFFVLSSLVASFTTPLTNAMNAIGKIKITLYLMVFWTIATWVLTITFINVFGYTGVAGASLALSFSVILVVWLMKRFTPFSFFGSIKFPLLAGLIQTLWYSFLRGNVPYDIPRLAVVAVSGGILYMAIIWLFEKRRIRQVIALSFGKSI